MSIRDVENLHICRLREMDELAQFDYLVNLGVAFGRNSEIEKNENRIKGCKTAIWLNMDGRKISVSSDSLVVSGLLSILTEMYDGEQEETIRANPIKFLDIISNQVVYPEIRENGIKKLFGILSGSKED